jgi:hypothetical protein
VVLDPWIPIVKEGTPKALTAQSHSLGYRSLQAILFDGERHQLPLLAEATADEQRTNREGTWIAQVLVSGDGGTDGFLRREIPAPPAVRMRMHSAPAAVAVRARLFVNLAAQASGKALRSALLQFVDGSDDVDWKNRDFTRAVEPWTDRYEQAVDAVFFELLFDSIQRHPEDDVLAQRQWVAWLSDTARDHLAMAVQGLPTRDGARLFARGRAERMLRMSLHKQFAGLLPTRSDRPAEAPPQPEHSHHE